MVKLQKGSKSNSEKKKTAPQSRKWCFTFNNYDQTLVDNYYDLLSSVSVKGIFGEEVSNSGTPHLQGFIEFKNGRTANGVQKLLPTAHWEWTKGSPEQNFTYCSKQNKVYSWGDWTPPEPIENPMDGVELFDWQNEIMELIKTKPDRRTIHWYWEPTGNIGKTTFAKGLCLTHNALFVSGKAGDIKCAIADMKIKPKIVIFGIPKDTSEFTSYAALEQVKDGLFFSTKYESGMCLYNCPHVIVFANIPPIEEGLSLDRWNVKRY